MYPNYNLVLAITHDCNLRCSYCYAGPKSHRSMPMEFGRKAVDRAIASTESGGTFYLSFFGGEPLLRAEWMQELTGYAREKACVAGLKMQVAITTNGTVTTPVAWSMMTVPDVRIGISCDGLPHIHDRHRRSAAGKGTAEQVIDTIRKLVAEGKPPDVIMVVRPDTLEQLPAGIEFVSDLGARRIEPTLDLWTAWTEQDINRLQEVVASCAAIWRRGLPSLVISWFNEKAIHLAQLGDRLPDRCGFGAGEITVAASGRLYPCERLVGEDPPDSPVAIPGHVLDDDDFLHVRHPDDHPIDLCHECAMLSMCSTFCRCANYVRTGKVRQPDLLLCAWNQACLNETGRVLLQDSAGKPRS